MFSPRILLKKACPPVQRDALDWAPGHTASRDRNNGSFWNPVGQCRRRIAGNYLEKQQLSLFVIEKPVLFVDGIKSRNHSKPSMNCCRIQVFAPMRCLLRAQGPGLVGQDEEILDKSGVSASEEIHELRRGSEVIHQR